MSMARFKPGDKKPEGSGMKKGQVTKKTLNLLDIFDEFDFCPARSLLEQITAPDAEDKFIPTELANLKVKLMEFKFPRRKAVEHSGSVGTDLFSKILDSIDGSSKPDPDKQPDK